MYDRILFWFDYYLLDHHGDKQHSHPAAFPSGSQDSQKKMPGSPPLSNKLADDVNDAHESTDAGAGPHANSTDNWLTHLDGLRGIAVLGVLLFHFEILGCVGGFTGVDMFLVLSGFLMTKNILKKLTAGQFSLKDFYIARFWRLYPSSLFTSLWTAIVAYFVFPPSLALDTVKSALASIGLMSNVLFSTEVGGYFDRDVILKPLLHTWSLSLEEQFYLFWPLFLIFMFWSVKGSGSLTVFYNRLGHSVTWIIALSFALAVRMSILSPTYAWYLLPTRVYEFLFGSIALFIGNQIPGSCVFHEILAVISLLGIIFSYFVMSDAVPFPGWYSLPCTLGPLVLINLPDTWVSCNILCSRVLRFFGKISYAAYLIHWPLWVYYSYLKGSREHGWSMFGLTIVLAHIQLHVYENPMRLTGPKPASSWKKLFLFGMLAFTIFFCSWGAVTNGWEFWVSSLASPSSSLLNKAFSPANDTTLGLPEFGSNGNENYTYRARVVPKSLQQAQEYAEPFLEGRLDKIYPYLEFMGKPDQRKPRAIVLADSYYSHFYHPLSLVADTDNVYFATNYASGCFLMLGHTDAEIRKVYPPGPRERCHHQTIAAEEMIRRLKQKSVVILVFRWTNTVFVQSSKLHDTKDFEEGVTKMFEAISKHGHKILMFGAPPGGQQDIRDCLKRRATSAFSVKKCPVWDAPEPRFDLFNNVLKNISSSPQFRNDIRFVDIRPLLCKSETDCRQIGTLNRPINRDGVAHMTSYGAMLFYNPIREELDAVTKMLPG